MAEDLELLELVVLEVVEQKLGPEVPVGIAEVVEADDVHVLDAPRIFRMPSTKNERRRESLVAEPANVDLPVRAPDVG